MSKIDLTAERLRELLHYDTETGIFTWIVSTSVRVQVGDIAGCKNNEGYLQIKIDKRNHRAHRLAWLHTFGSWPTGQIDHINGQRSDNRIANLRSVTHSVNQQNRKFAQRSNKSTGLMGVSRYGNGFRARIKLDGKSRNIGTFDTPELANAAYLSAKRDIHPGCTL
jgi:hypothetical protein